MHCSTHALRRGAQRRITDDHIHLALDWGRLIRQPEGRRAFHLGRKEARRARKHGVELPKGALGVTVVLAPEGWIVTVVRSSDRRRLMTYGRRPRR